MTIAIDQWAEEQGGAQRPPAGGEYVSEDELSGAGGPDAFMAAPGEHETNEEAPSASPANPSNDEDEALRSKRAKDKRIMMIAGGVLAVLGAAFAASLAVRPPQQQAGRVAPSMAPLDAAQQAAQPGAAPVIASIAPQPSAAAPAPIDFDQQMSQAGNSSLPPGQSAAAPGGAARAGVTPGTTAAAGEVALAATPPSAAAPFQAASGLAPAASAAGTPSGPHAPSVPPGAAARSNQAQQADLEQLRAELASVRKEMKDSVASLRAEIGSSHAAQGHAAPRREATIRPAKAGKPFVGITEKAEAPKSTATPKAPEPGERYTQVPGPVIADTKATPSAPPPAIKGAKVRSDASVYAISNGRAWVHWSGDGENHMVGLNSVLPDSSRVTKLDDVNGIVFTTGGEIHVKPAK